MKLINTGDPQFKPSVVMMVYGEGGIGKTTFAASAPKPLLADCEGGTKYLGLRGVNIPVALIENWGDMGEVLRLAKGDEYETIIIDPIGELMEKLKRYMVAKGDSKLVQKDGSPSMAGWGWLKKTMKDYLKVLRDLGKHVIIIAHVVEKDDEGRIVKRPSIETKIDRDIVNLVDVVGYMTSIEQDGEDIRIIRVDANSDKFVAKDRTGQLGKVIPPKFPEIIKACQGTGKYKWMKNVEVKPVEPKPNAGEDDKELEENKKITDALKLDPEDIPVGENVVAANNDDLNEKLIKARGKDDDGENNKTTL